MNQSIFHGPIDGETIIAGVHAHSDGTVNFNFGTHGQQRPVRPFSNVPFPQDPYFVERPDISGWLDAKSEKPNTRVALVGLGGIGKSQFAIHFAQKVRQQSPETFVFWVPAHSAARFKDAYRNIADQLQLPAVRGDSKVDVLRLVCDWLSNEENGPWLMVVDNADDSGVFFSSHDSPGPGNSQPLASYLPKVGRGSIIFTSRSMVTAERLVGADNICNLPLMGKWHALQLLKVKLGQECYGTEEEMIHLVDVLGYMPLAISQAAAFIKRRSPRTSITTYLHQFSSCDKNKASLLNQDSGDVRRDETASNSVVTTWQMTFEQIRHERPPAAQLLFFMTFFNPQAIDDSLLRAYSRKHGRDCEVDINEDLEVLRGYSLVETTADENILKMHPLVQFCTRVWLSSVDDIQQWKQKFLHIILDEYPSKEPDSGTVRQKFDSIVEELSKEEPTDNVEALKWAKLLIYASDNRSNRGRDHEAEGICRRALKTYERILGEEHSTTLDTAFRLIMVLRDQGRYQEAEQMNRRDVEVCERLYGKEHPNTLHSISSLALVLKWQGKFDEAEVLTRRALQSCKRVFGREHEQTLENFRGLSRLLQDQGKFVEGEKMCREVLATTQAVFGNGNRNTIKCMSGLASVLRFGGKYEESEKLARHVFKERERVYGYGYPATLQSMTLLSAVLRDLGRYVEAERIGRQSREYHIKVYGKQHPETFFSSSCLVSVLVKQGKYKEGECICRPSLEACESLLGKNDAGTMELVHNLALVLMYQGQYEESRALNQQNIERSEKMVGKHHPDTLSSMQLLGFTLREQRRYREAERVLRKVLTDRKVAIGSGHPHTLKTLSTLALVLIDQARYEEAERLISHFLQSATRAFGREHPEVFIGLNQLGLALQGQGKYSKAEPWMRQAMSRRERMLGSEHVDTVQSVYTLACLFHEQGRLSEAVAYYQRAHDGYLKILGPDHFTTKCAKSKLDGLEQDLLELTEGGVIV